MTRVDNIDLDAMSASVESLDKRVGDLEAKPVQNVDLTGIQSQIDALNQKILVLAPLTADAVVKELIAQLAKGVVVTNGSTSASSVSVGGTVANPLGFTGQEVGGSSDVNMYPLNMPAGNVNGAPLVLGNGKNTFEVILANSPGQNPPVSFNVVFVRPDGTMQGVAGPLTSTSFDGEASPGQSFKIKGPWGANPKFIIAPAAGGGTIGMFIHGASCDLVPLGIYGALDSRGYISAGDATAYNSNGGTATLMQTINKPSGASSDATASNGVVGATPSVITGATINGSEASPTTLDKLVASVPAGGTLVLPAGKFIGVATVVSANIRVEGAGQGNTEISATGLRLVQDKAAFLLSADGAYFKNLTVAGARIAAGLGANGAGFRQAGAGISFTLENVETYGCQNGILAFPGDVTLINCHFHDDGEPGSQRTHDIYISGDKNSVVNVVDGVYEKCADVHAFKSRAYTNNILRGLFVAGGNGSCLDIPDGGKTVVNGATLRMPPGVGSDLNIVTFGLEDTQGYDAFELTLVDVVIDDILGTGLIQGKTGATLTLQGNCTYNGPNPPRVTGFNVVGTFTKR